MKIRLVVALAASVSLLAPGMVASAAQSPSPDVAQLLNVQGALGHLERVEARPSAGLAIESKPDGGVAKVTVPTDPSDPVVLASGKNRIAISLPFANYASSAEPVGSAAAAYDNNNGSLTGPSSRTAEAFRFSRSLRVRVHQHSTSTASTSLRARPQRSERRATSRSLPLTDHSSGVWPRRGRGMQPVTMCRPNML